MKQLLIILAVLCFLVATPNEGIAQIGKLKKMKNKAKNKVLGKKDNNSGSSSDKYESQGVTSPIHKKYQNKIVFSNEVIDFQNENESQFLSTYEFGQDLHYRVFADDSHLNYLVEEADAKGVSREDLEEFGTYITVFTIDGKKVHESIRDIEQSLKAKSVWTTFRGEYYLNEGGNNSAGMQDFVDVVSKIEKNLKAGSHKVKVEIYPYLYVGNFKDDSKSVEIKAKKPSATGSFTMNVASLPLVKSNDPVLCRIPRKGMSESTVEQTIMKRSQGDNKAVKMVITSLDWTIYRHDITGVVLKREAQAVIGMKNKNGTCGYQETTVVQEHDGTKFMEARKGEYGNYLPVPCSCLED